MTGIEIYKHINAFKAIRVNDKLVNPIPNNKRVTIYCKSKDEEFFNENVLKSECGINLLIAKKWILHEDLMNLLNAKTSNP